MEIILSILFLVGIWAYIKAQGIKACNHSNTYRIDWGKVNDDRRMNNLSETQVNKNIYAGKYDYGEKFMTEEEIRAENNAAWEKYKKDHPWMPLN